MSGVLAMNEGIASVLRVGALVKLDRGYGTLNDWEVIGVRQAAHGPWYKFRDVEFRDVVEAYRGAVIHVVKP